MGILVTVAVAGFAILLIILGVAIVSNASTGGAPTIVCDMTGTVVGSVYDDNLQKQGYVTSISLSPTNCHQKTIWDNFATASVANQAALFTPTYSNFHITALDLSGNKVRTASFTITLPTGTIRGDFTQQITVPALVQGQTYSLQATNDWTGTQVLFQSQVTV